MNYFWTNTIWFILLGVTTIIEVAYFLIKSKNRTLTVAFYLAVSGMVFLIEMGLFGFFRAYDYYPKIFHQISQLDDNLAGNVFSQFSLAASALLICVLNLKYYWYLIIALLYGAIEQLFLYLGIYTQHWYHTWMTVAGLILLFIIVKLAYNKVFTGRPRRIFKYILMYFTVFAPHTDLISWPFRLVGGVPTFNERILTNPVISGELLFGISFNVLTNTILIAYFLRFKWWGHSMVILALYLFYYMAYRFNYIIYKDIGLSMLFATLEIFGMYLWVFVFDRLYDNHLEKKRQPFEE